MSWQVTKLVWSLNATMTQKAVLARMGDLADPNGSGVFISQIQLADDVGCSDKSVRNVLRWAVAEGLIIEVPSTRRAKEYRFDLQIMTEKSVRFGEIDRNDVPGNRQEVPENRNQFPPDRNDVPVDKDEQPEPGSGQTGTCCQSDRNVVPVYKREPFRKPEREPLKEEVSSNPSQEQPPALSEKILAILQEVPGLSRATHAKADHIAEVIDEYPEIDEFSWVQMARACRDQSLTKSQFGANAVFSMSPSAKLREFVQQKTLNDSAAGRQRAYQPSRNEQSRDWQPPPMPADYAGVE